LVEKVKYDPYGQATVTVQDGQSATGNVYLFQGRRLDPETGLYHFRNRDYGARFWQKDQMEQQWSRLIHEATRRGRLVADWLRELANLELLSAWDLEAIRTGVARPLASWEGALEFREGLMALVVRAMDYSLLPPDVPKYLQVRRSLSGRRELPHRIYYQQVVARSWGSAVLLVLRVIIEKNAYEAFGGSPVNRRDPSGSYTHPPSAGVYQAASAILASTTPGFGLCVCPIPATLDNCWKGETPGGPPCGSLKCYCNGAAADRTGQVPAEGQCGLCGVEAAALLALILALRRRGARQRRAKERQQ